MKMILIIKKIYKIRRSIIYYTELQLITTINFNSTMSKFNSVVTLFNYGVKFFNQKILNIFGSVR